MEVHLAVVLAEVVEAAGKNMRKKILISGLIIVAITILIFILLPYLKPKDNLLKVSGRVEADEIELSSRISGRLEKVLINDGSEVKKGDTVAILEDDEIQSKHREILNKIAEITESIKAAELNLEFTKTNISHSIEEAKKVLEASEARLKQSNTKLENARKEFLRYSALLEKDVISKERFDSIKLAFDLSSEENKVVLSDVEKAKVALKKAEDSRILINVKEQEILSMKKSLGQLKELLQQVDINLGYTKIIAPVDGVILRKIAEPGEVVSGGSVIGTMINPESIHIRTFVPEKYIGNISNNIEAEIFTDAYPDKPIKGYVCYISDRAEFTPKEVQSYEERVKQVFAVKVCVKSLKNGEKDNKISILKKGMPVDVRFNIYTK